MKYVVSVNGERVIVEREADTVTVEETARRTTIEEVVGTPIQLVRIGDEVHRVVVQRRAGRGIYTLWLDGFRYEVEALDERARAICDLSAAAAGPAGPTPVVAPMPGLIVHVKVEVGDAVQAGQGLVVMEAMKMENELRAPAAGKVKAVLVTPGAAVEKGAVLVELE
ncbi:MAG: biotin/lipoyl-binding protein [Gemmatimonadota bacterium]|nr:biotin/lipoyl-binding protein [Gemmatimonadota bacterium]